MADFYLYNEWISSKMRLLKASNQNEEWNLQEMAKVTPTWRLHAGFKVAGFENALFLHYENMPVQYTGNYTAIKLSCFLCVLFFFLF